MKNSPELYLFFFNQNGIMTEKELEFTSIQRIDRSSVTYYKLKYPEKVKCTSTLVLGIIEKIFLTLLLS